MLSKPNPNQHIWWYLHLQKQANELHRVNIDLEIRERHVAERELAVERREAAVAMKVTYND